MAVTYWNSDLCSKGTDHLVLKATKHSGIFNLWLRICCTKASNRSYSGFMVQTEDVWNTTRWGNKSLCDNKSVVDNSSKVESTLKKKHTAICYHRTCEAVAGGWIIITHEDGKMNLADLLSKMLPGPRRKELLGAHFMVRSGKMPGASTLPQLIDTTQNGCVRPLHWKQID